MELRFKKTKNNPVWKQSTVSLLPPLSHRARPLARLMHISSHRGHFFTCTVIDGDLNTRTKALRRIRRGSVLILRLFTQLVFVLVLVLSENV